MNKVVEDFSAQPADLDATREGLNAAFLATPARDPKQKHVAIEEELDMSMDEVTSIDRETIDWRSGGGGGEKVRMPTYAF